MTYIHNIELECLPELFSYDRERKYTKYTIKFVVVNKRKQCVQCLRLLLCVSFQYHMKTTLLACDVAQATF